MPDKTIIQRAQGYGIEPIAVTVQINGANIYQGTIPTTDTPVPQLPEQWTPELGVDSWSWTVPDDFQGTNAMSVSVQNGIMLLCDTFVQEAGGDPKQIVYPHDQDGETTGDPFSGVTINGAAQTPMLSQGGPGQWVWKLQAGDEFACTVNIPVPTQPVPVAVVTVDSEPENIAPGATGDFAVTIAADQPRPQTLVWQVINVTSTNTDFVAVYGNVTFANLTSTFGVTTVVHDPVQPPKTFRVVIVDPDSGDLLGAGNSFVNIT